MCNHSQAEKDTAIADFACPICLGVECDELRAMLAEQRREIARLREKLHEYEILYGNGEKPPRGIIRA
jgi:hypothetical protein